MHKKKIPTSTPPPWIDLCGLCQIITLPSALYSRNQYLSDQLTFFFCNVIWMFIQWTDYQNVKLALRQGDTWLYQALNKNHLMYFSNSLELNNIVLLMYTGNVYKINNINVQQVWDIPAFHKTIYREMGVLLFCIILGNNTRIWLPWQCEWLCE